MVLDRDEVCARLCAALDPHGEVREAYLFGSVARGSAAGHSDVDVAVYLDPRVLQEKGLGYDWALAAELMAALGTNKVDVVVLNRAPPLLYHRVLQGSVRLLSRDLTATSRRESEALSRYFDYLPQLRKIDEAHRRRSAAGGFGR